MKKIKLFLTSALVSFLYNTTAFASAFEDIVKKALGGDLDGLTKNELSFSGTTIWVIVASSFICFGIVGLASQVAQAFGGAQLGGPVSNTAQATIGAVAGGAAKLAGKGGKALNDLRKEHKKSKELEQGLSTMSASSPSAGAKDFEKSEDASKDSLSGKPPVAGQPPANEQGSSGGKPPADGQTPANEQDSPGGKPPADGQGSSEQSASAAPAEGQSATGSPEGGDGDPASAGVGAVLSGIGVAANKVGQKAKDGLSAIAAFFTKFSSAFGSDSRKATNRHEYSQKPGDYSRKTSDYLRDAGNYHKDSDPESRRNPNGRITRIRDIARDEAENVFNSRSGGKK